jgi:hypothetical protein
MSARASIAAFSVVTLLALPAALAEEPAGSSSPEELARELVQLTGGGELGKQAMTQMVDAFRGANPDLPQEFWDEFIASVDVTEIEEMVIPIYVEHLSAEEMSAAIAFFGSPAGRSLVQKQPAILRESMAAGQLWGQRLGEQVMERIARYKRQNTDTWASPHRRPPPRTATGDRRAR